MNIDDILVIVVLAVLLLYVYRGCKCEPVTDAVSDMMGSDADANVDSDEDEVENMSSVSNRVEGMAPLDFGTFYNNYPRGECRTGKYWERKPCEVGNCPLGTTVSDQQFCRIQCAQDPDPEERQGCYEFCMRHTC